MRNPSTADARRSRAWAWHALAILMIAALPGTLAAQTGEIAGIVEGQDGAPVAGAFVQVEDTRLGTLSGSDGRFALRNVPAGTHRLRVSRLGYREAFVTDASVTEGGSTEVAVVLEGTALEVGGVVVSAARREQRLTDAPATITRIDADMIAETPGPFAMALKQVKGLDFIQVGATSVAVNARGFNSSFNNRMLMMEDGRIAVLPENGLPVGQFTAIPSLDLAGVEVLVGPGAALYGPDASSGVITLQSKDPREYPGTSAQVTGGSRGYGNVQARHAGVFGDFGYKAVGEWLQVDDFENVLFYGPEGALEETGAGGEVDWQSRVTRGQGALTHYGDDHRLELSAGASRTNGVGQTSVGRNQLEGWTYNFLQGQLNWGGWYFNAYRAQSQSGTSYALNRFTENRAAFPEPSDEEIRLMSDWPSDGRLYAAEIQNNFDLPALLNTGLTWGVQLRRDVVSSDRQWLTDRLTGEDLTIDQVGVYAQSETPILPSLQLVLASRFDRHENYDPQFSPKAGLIFNPTPDQAVRLTYNRAFKSPTTLQTNFFIPDFVPAVGVFGNTAGYQ